MYTCNKYKVNTYLHSAKQRMRYNSDKIVTHGCKLHMEALLPFMSDLIFCCEKEFQNGTLFYY